MPMSSSVTEKETACLTLKANDEHEVDSQGWWSSLLSSVTQEKLHSSPTNPWKLGTPAPLFQHYIPCCFTILHYHNKRDKGKNSYKVQGLNPHCRMGFTKLREKAGEAKEEQIPKFFSSKSCLQRSHGCKLGVCLKMSFNTKLHQCYLLKHKHRRLYSLTIQEQLNHKPKIFIFIM